MHASRAFLILDRLPANNVYVRNTSIFLPWGRKSPRSQNLLRSINFATDTGTANNVYVRNTSIFLPWGRKIDGLEKYTHYVRYFSVIQ
jgi:hypothetical protein